MTTIIHGNLRLYIRK